jgi:hypothetical protein
VTWFMQLARAAWDRFDTWRASQRNVGADIVAWLRQLRRLPDRPLGPHTTRRRPGQRYEGRHRRIPDEPVRGPS